MNLVIWTARLAVAAYLTALGLLWRQKSRLKVQIVWTAGFIVFGLHVAAAFHFVHHWSHAAAWQHTAEQTKAVTGWEWGGGIWFNYLFFVLWGIDVLLGWLPLASNERVGRRLTYVSFAVRIYLAFIVINATVVFGPQWWKPVMIVIVLSLMVLAFRSHRHSLLSPDQNPQHME